MQNRREFLGCAGAAAALLAMPAAGAILNRQHLNPYGLTAFHLLLGQRIALREGGFVRVVSIDPKSVDARCEQFVVRMRSSSALDSGLYHLEIDAGPIALYLDAGRDAGGSTLAASFSRLRA